jgi:hypothetical protein
VHKIESWAKAILTTDNEQFQILTDLRLTFLQATSSILATKEKGILKLPQTLIFSHFFKLKEMGLPGFLQGENMERGTRVLEVYL